MSKTALRSALYSASKTLDEGRLSYQSLVDYKAILRLCLEQLSQMGFILRSIDSLKQKHVEKLIQHWQENKLSAGTIKNRVSVLRRITELSGRKEVVKTNADYQLAPRQYHRQVSIAITDIDLDKIEDPYIRASVSLQQVFGLRREEAIKFKPHQADERLAIRLQGSWTKGGIARLIPFTNPTQRECLDRVKALVGKHESLIPKGSTYRQQRMRYDNVTQALGYQHLHGLRHAYAQRRYEEMTHFITKGYGWKSPINGGPKKEQLNDFEKHVDRQVRLMLSQELGHSREAIVKSYIG
jgi:integrase